MRDTGICRCGRGTLYDVLQVSPWCEPEVIQAAFRALARTRHPDVNRDPDAEDQMRRLNVAYQTLSDPGRRARYDEELALEAAQAARPTPTARAAPSAPTAGPSATPGWAPSGGASTGYAGWGVAPNGSSNGHANGHAARGTGAAPRPAASGSRPGANAAPTSGPAVPATA